MKRRPFLRLCGALALLLSCCQLHAEDPFMFAATPGKLPKDVVPLQYAVHLAPDLAANTFLGAETIEVDVRQPTRLIMLNAAMLAIDAASLSGPRLPELKLTPELDEQQQTLSLRMAQPLPAGRYQLSLKFHGHINREARGLFRLPYRRGTQDKVLLASQMEPTDARRMLPLWDEPAFRARFRLTVDLPEQFSAYSNTPVEKSDKLEGGIQRVTFGVTPAMPGYLLVLVAGELERSSIKQDGVELGVVTTAGQQASGAYALNASKDLLRFYNSYFGLPYPLSKLDQIAVPGGFSGAMENWGAIMTNEAALLVDPQRSPESSRRTAFAISAHEIAHQWFGNLVTMAWWDKLWLNEGFASWMGTKATERFHPEWRPWLDKLVERETVMEQDALPASHPVQRAVTNEAQAANAFDNITYVKGQALLRMLESYIGEDSFRRGLRTYMTRHQYGNTTSADLWSALEAASGKPVAAIADDWTTQTGYPLIEVAQHCENGKRKVTLSQQAVGGAERLWRVPLQVGVVGGKSINLLLEAGQMTLTQPGCDGALLVDPNGVGYFRLQYDKAGLDALAAQWARLPDAARIKLLADSWHQVVTGKTELASYLKLAAQLRDEPRLAVWEGVIGRLELLDRFAVGQPQRDQVRSAILKLLGPKFRKLGWQDLPADTAEERQLRFKIAAALARAGDEVVVAQAKARFQAFLASAGSVAPSALDFVTATAGRYADQATYDALTGLFMRSQVNEERNRYGQALAGALDPALAARTLTLAIAPNVPPQLGNRLLPAVAQAGHADMTWTFAMAHRDTLLKNQSATAMRRALPSLLADACDLAQAAVLERFAGEQTDPDAGTEALRVAASVREHARQKALLLPQLDGAFRQVNW